MGQRDYEHMANPRTLHVIQRFPEQQREHPRAGPISRHAVPLYACEFVPVISVPLYLRADDAHTPVLFVIRHLLPVITDTDSSDDSRSISAQVVLLISI